jgi:hypothetical protein
VNYIALLLSVVFSAPILAGAYKCSAGNSYEWMNNSLERQTHLNWKEFVIDRNSGKTYTNTPGSFKRLTYEVLNEGDNNTAFRALYNDGSEGIYYISIGEYVDSKKKPLIYFSEYMGADIMTGTCINY